MRRPGRSGQDGLQSGRAPDLLDGEAAIAIPVDLQKLTAGSVAAGDEHAIGRQDEGVADVGMGVVPGMGPENVTTVGVVGDQVAVEDQHLLGAGEACQDR